MWQATKYMYIDSVAVTQCSVITYRLLKCYSSVPDKYICANIFQPGVDRWKAFHPT